MFSNILVGVEFDAEGQIAAGCQRAIESALWLAEGNDASLDFAHVIDIPEDARSVLAFEPQATGTAWLRKVESCLEALVQQASSQGTSARANLLYGKHWRALVRHVTEHAHDLVIVGTHGRSLGSRMLLGSTGNRLLRYCPCPVWVVKPTMPAEWGRLLLAHDLTPVGDHALKIAAEFARKREVPLDILHVLEHPEEQRFLGTITQEDLDKRQSAAQAALEEACARFAPGLATKVEVQQSGSAHTVILDHVKTNDINMLCMGTLARSGLPGLLTGNTAESVLPWVDCSLLVVKPADFECPPDAA